MKVIIAGSREFNDYESLWEYICGLDLPISEVVCGMARGADLLGKKWAHDNQIPVKEFHADWERYGKTSGIIRNIGMAKYADALIACWDGKSPGTKHMISEARKRNLRVEVFRYSKKVKKVSNLDDFIVDKL